MKILFTILILSSFALRATAEFKNAADFGFSPEKSPAENVAALQKAVDGGGTVVVSKAGTYSVNDTVFLDDHTKLLFGANVVVKKVRNQKKPFLYVFANRGIYKKQYNRDICLDGLTLSVNGVDYAAGGILGLIGHISFYYAKDIKITRFRCDDLARGQFCIQVCTFEDLLIDDVIIYGQKDGIHLGRGKRFKISNCAFRTFDDAIALNAHDYDGSNPELGWIEDGVIENITDLDDVKTTGFFCRILAGAWTDWKAGMKLQKSDTVVSNGALYRVRAKPDGKIFTSKTRPEFSEEMKVLDGIEWHRVQSDLTYNAGVRNVVFRDIFLYKPRIAFSVHFDRDVWSRSYYPDAPFVEQRNLVFDNVHILHDKPTGFLYTRTPVNTMVLKNCFLKNNSINISGIPELKDSATTSIKLIACSVDVKKDFTLVLCPSKIKPVDVVSVGTTISSGARVSVRCACPQSRIQCDFSEISKK